MPGFSPHALLTRRARTEGSHAPTHALMWPGIESHEQRRRKKITKLQFLKSMGKMNRRVLVRSATERGGSIAGTTTHRRGRGGDKEEPGASAPVPLPDLGDLDLEVDEFVMVLLVIIRHGPVVLAGRVSIGDVNRRVGRGRDSTGREPRGRRGEGGGKRVWQCGLEGAGSRSLSEHLEGERCLLLRGICITSARAATHTRTSGAEAVSFSCGVLSGKMSLVMCRSPCSNASRRAPDGRVPGRGEEHHQLPT
jgi:hypothetical protein